MTEKKYPFEDFASDLLKNQTFKKGIDNIFNNLDLKDKQPKEIVKEQLNSQDENGLNQGFLADENIFAAALSCNKETLVSYLNYYYDTASKYYEYWEYRYSGFGNGYQCFWPFNSYILPVCIKYFESINEQEKADCSFLFLMCGLSYCKDLFELDKEEQEEYNEDNEIICFYKMFEYKMESIKPYIFEDWQTVHPSITWNIGKYYLLEENYSKAKDFFTLGASLDYEDRQSAEPFIAVGKNQYELGIIYRDGLGVKANSKKAQEYFMLAECNGVDSNTFDDPDDYYSPTENVPKAKIKVYSDEELAAELDDFDLDKKIESLGGDEFLDMIIELFSQEK